MMKHGIPVFLAAMLLLAAPAAGADTAERPSRGTLWAGTGLSAAAGMNGWGVSGVLQYLGLGFDLEYGVIPWASLQAQWRPGVILSAYTGFGSAGRLGDIEINGRFGILGERDSLVRLDFLRLTFAAGVKAPLFPEAGTAWEPGTHLWGAKLGLSCDYLAAPWFHLNLGTVVLLNPGQASQNSDFSPKLTTVKHPFDLTVELEPRFRVLGPNGLIFTLPVVYEYSPESQVRDQGLGDGGHFLSQGFGCAMAIRDLELPFEVGMSCFVSLYGADWVRLQRVELTGKIEIPLLRGGRNGGQ